MDPKLVLSGVKLARKYLKERKAQAEAEAYDALTKAASQAEALRDQLESSPITAAARARLSAAKAELESNFEKGFEAFTESDAYQALKENSVTAPVVEKVEAALPAPAKSKRCAKTKKFALVLALISAVVAAVYAYLRATEEQPGSVPPRVDDFNNSGDDRLVYSSAPETVPDTAADAAAAAESKKAKEAANSAATDVSDTDDASFDAAIQEAEEDADSSSADDAADELDAEEEEK